MSNDDYAKYMAGVVISVFMACSLIAITSENTTTINGQEAITLTEKQLECGNTVLVDKNEINETFIISENNKYRVKVEETNQEDKIYELSTIDSTKTSNNIFYFIPIIIIILYLKK